MARTVINLASDTVRMVQAQCYITAFEHGFHDEPLNIDQKLLLTIGELIEAQNELRMGRAPKELYFDDDTTVQQPKPEGFGIELADAIIRLFDLAQACDIDLQNLIELKMNFNELRPYKHGKKF